MLHVADLKNRQPRAWSRLLAQDPDTRGPIVKAVEQEFVTTPESGIRYYIALAGHPEPITLFAKKTNSAEARFYRDIAPLVEGLAPYCWFSHIESINSWIFLDEAQNDWPPKKWVVIDVEEILARMSSLHASFWEKEADLIGVGLILNWEQVAGKTTPPLDEQVKEIREGDAQPMAEDRRIRLKGEAGAILSEHAKRVSGNLAPILANAASGLETIRSFGGWPGVLEERELTAMADLIDDPLPMLFPLRQLPKTLLHGNPSPKNWRINIFGDYRLVNWEKNSIGPGVCDLVNFIDQLALYSEADEERFQPGSWPIIEETMEDSYILAMGRELGSRFDALAFRQAIPAARCFYVLTNWLPRINNWFQQIACDKELWLKQNQMSDDELSNYGFDTFLNIRPYLSTIFERWGIAYRSL